MGRGPTNLPPVHPAVSTFRWMNWRQDDIFAKKNRHIFLTNRKKNNIKKFRHSGVDGGAEWSYREVIIGMEIGVGF